MSGEQSLMHLWHNQRDYGNIICVESTMCFRCHVSKALMHLCHKQWSYGNIICAESTMCLRRHVSKAPCIGDIINEIIIRSSVLRARCLCSHQQIRNDRLLQWFFLESAASHSAWRCAFGSGFPQRRRRLWRGGRDTNAYAVVGGCPRWIEILPPYTPWERVINLCWTSNSWILVVGTNFHTRTVYSYLVAIMPQGRESSMAQARPGAILTFLKVTVPPAQLWVWCGVGVSTCVCLFHQVCFSFFEKHFE